MITDGLPVALEYNPIFVTFLWVIVAGGVAALIAHRRWLGVWLLAPALIQVAVSVFTPRDLIAQRYLLTAMPALAICIAATVQWLQERWKTALGYGLAAILGLLMIVGLADKLLLAPYQPFDWKAFAGFLQREMQPGDAVVFDTSMAYFPVEESGILGIHKTYGIANEREAEVQVREIASHPRVWYVDYQSRLADPRSLVIAELWRTHRNRTTWISRSGLPGDQVVTILFEGPK